MNLRKQLKNVKIQNAETIQSYFKRVSHIKEHLEARDEEVENVEIVMTTLNGLPIAWDSFIQGICARKKLVKFSRPWEEFSQEEAQIVAREEKMGNEDQALTIHTKCGFIIGMVSYQFTTLMIHCFLSCGSLRI